MHSIIAHVYSFFSSRPKTPKRIEYVDYWYHLSQWTRIGVWGGVLIRHKLSPRLGPRGYFSSKCEQV